MPELPFADHAPPPGGLARLRSRLDETDGPRVVRRLLWPSLVAAASAVAFALRAPAPERMTLRSPALDAARRDLPAEPVAALGNESAVQRILVRGSVIVYRVDSLPATQ